MKIKVEAGNHDRVLCPVSFEIPAESLKGFEWKVAITETLLTKVPVTLVNGVIAVICAGALTLALRPALKKAHIL